MTRPPTPEEAALRRAAAVVGGQAALASRLGFKSRRNVWPWFNGRRVPAEYCPAIERLAAGAVRCEDLRPDVEWGVLRGSAQHAQATDHQLAAAPAVAQPTEARNAA